MWLRYLMDGIRSVSRNHTCAVLAVHSPKQARFAQEKAWKMGKPNIRFEVVPKEIAHMHPVGSRIPI